MIPLCQMPYPSIEGYGSLFAFSRRQDLTFPLEWGIIGEMANSNWGLSGRARHAPQRGAYRSDSGKTESEYRVRSEAKHISNAARRISTVFCRYARADEPARARYTARRRPSRFDMPPKAARYAPVGRKNSPTNPNLYTYFPRKESLPCISPSRSISTTESSCALPSPPSL